MRENDCTLVADNYIPVGNSEKKIGCVSFTIPINIQPYLLSFGVFVWYILGVSYRTTSVSVGFSSEKNVGKRGKKEIGHPAPMAIGFFCKYLAGSAWRWTCYLDFPRLWWEGFFHSLLAGQKNGWIATFKTTTLECFYILGSPRRITFCTLKHFL